MWAPEIDCFWRAVMRRRLAGCGALVGVVASCVAVAGPAFGAAEIERFTSSASVGPVFVDDTCAGAGVVGVLTGTETIDGQFVTTSTGEHFTGTDTLVYRVDFPDGSYLLASQRQPLHFTSAQADRVVTFGSTLHERGTLYDANGNVLGYEQFHARNRTTIVDGRVVADFDRGFITCR
jgi:hypothetical protein